MINYKNHIGAFLVLLLLFSGCASNATYQEDIDMKRVSFRDKVERGMSKEDVKNLLGEPDEIWNSQNNKHLAQDEEQWFYRGKFMQIFKPKKIITFNNGIVTDIYVGSWAEK